MSRACWSRPLPIVPSADATLGRPAGRSASRSVSQQILTNSRQFLSGLLNQQETVPAVVLPPRLFRVIWIAVVGAHVLCAAFLAGSAVTYSYLTNPIMAYYVQLWSPTRGNENYTLYAAIFALVGAIHALRVLQLLYRSIQERRLVFRRIKTKSPQSRRSSGPLFSNSARVLLERSNVAARLTQPNRQRYELMLQSVRFGWKAIFSRSGLFGVESQHFLTIFLFREVIELSTQTYQAYRSSHLLPRVWLNDILVAMLVANCWSTLVVQHFLRHQPAHERVVALFADAFICIAMVIVVPSVLFASYAKVFDIPNHRFGPSVSFYDPVFMAIFVLEARLALVSSFADFVAKLIPHFAIYLTLVSISGIVNRAQDAVTTKQTISIKVSSTKAHPTGPTAQNEGPEQETFVWMHRVLKGIFFLWGVGILALHLHAKVISQSNTVYGCRASTRPWLMSRVSCSSLVVNCNKYGTNAADDGIFQRIDTSVLAGLTLAHCPELVMPLLFPQFSNLMILHVYNSSVVSWGGTESMTSNPRLSTLIVARSQLSSIAAQGLLLPISLSTVQFSDTNLELIPETLPWSLHPMAVVAFDYSELKSIPTSLMSLQAFAISLKGNQLETVPQLAAIPPGQMFYGLELNDNPLRELPDTLESPFNYFIRLDLQGTNITALPPWTLTQVLGIIYMFNTPYCANTLPESLQQNVICFPRPATDPGILLPFDQFKAMYAYDRY